MTMIMVLGMLQAIWSAGTSVSDEIEGRTALTVLSKPVSRRSFILGKYAGIMLAVLVLFVVIGAVLVIVLSYKPIFEARETTRDVTTWQQGFAEIMTTLPLLILYFHGNDGDRRYCRGARNSPSPASQFCYLFRRLRNRQSDFAIGRVNRRKQ